MHFMNCGGSWPALGGVAPPLASFDAISEGGDHDLPDTTVVFGPAPEQATAVRVTAPGGFQRTARTHEGTTDMDGDFYVIEIPRNGLRNAQATWLDEKGRSPGAGMFVPSTIPPWPRPAGATTPALGPDPQALQRLPAAPFATCPVLDAAGCDEPALGPYHRNGDRGRRHRVSGSRPRADADRKAPDHRCERRRARLHHRGGGLLHQTARRARRGRPSRWRRYATRPSGRWPAAPRASGSESPAPPPSTRSGCHRRGDGQ